MKARITGVAAAVLVACLLLTTAGCGTVYGPCTGIARALQDGAAPQSKTERVTYAVAAVVDTTLYTSITMYAIDKLAESQGGDSVTYNVGRDALIGDGNSGTDFGRDDTYGGD